MAVRLPKNAKGVYRGYMPKDLPQHTPRSPYKPWFKVVGKPRITLYPKQEIEGFSDEPEYPPLNDGSYAGLKAQVRLDWYEKLRTLPTVEQKLFEISTICNQERMAHIFNWLPNYNSLPVAQYMTQTHVINSLPERYRIPASGPNEEGNTLDSLVERIRENVLNQIALDKYDSIKNDRIFVSISSRDGNKKAFRSNSMIQNIANNLKKTLALNENKELFDYQYDPSASIKSWWYHSGFPPFKRSVFYRMREDEQGKVNTMFQMEGASALNIRANHSIEPIVSGEDPLITDTSLVQKYSPGLIDFGVTYKFKSPVMLPGYWFGTEKGFDFPHTCFLSNDCLDLRNKPRNVEKDDEENCLNSQAILTAFGWLNGLSMYHGFTPFQELEYPFTCQVVTTDGKNWLFNVYQLNCHTFHRDLGGPMKNNLCWTSGMLNLYEAYEGGNFKGVNDDVIKLLIRFMSQKTDQDYTSKLSLCPYLGVDNQTDGEREEIVEQVRCSFKQKRPNWETHDWRVPLYEHIFFRSKFMRHRIRHMKARWHHPVPERPRQLD